ncbi:MAG: LuxR C-terminal-related transcriptional regulator, partial [Eggerthellaceae bacterium]|nr:LuxR C-terminal-related transcriptional regulator [Eggerthellaceae bacterium]
MIVCAGMGYGKTLAVSDFVRESEIPTMWIQFSEFDNVGLSFWESFTNALEQVNKPFAEECEDFGFPDTEDKLNQFFLQRDRALANMRYLVVLDDIHLIKDAAVINFVEHMIYNMLPHRTLILICRELPQINLSGLLVRGMVADIGEADLSFTESELAQYLIQQSLSSEIQNLPEIFVDTGGWAFIINFLVRILKKSSGYSGYVRTVMKQNIFQLMEREAWDVISERLQHFLVRLSLVNRLSAELVGLLAEGNEELLKELDEQRVIYLRFDSYAGCYLIHHLFLDYLRSKQEILSEKEISTTYRIAAEWCANNGFAVDALFYYEKICDYESLVDIIRDSSSLLLLSVAQHLLGVFERAPADTFDKVLHFASAHIRILLISGMWEEALRLLKHYERKLKALPATDDFRGLSLGALYCLWGSLRQFMCTFDDMYDFDIYYRKMSKCAPEFPMDQICESYPVGPWINFVGVSRKGAPLEYLDAVARSADCLASGRKNWLGGQAELGYGELLYYQGEINAAKSHVTTALERAQKDRHFETVHRALFYTMRLAVWQREYDTAERALKSMEAQLEENEYYNRFFTYDIALGWYYCTLRLPEKIPTWLKGKFTSFSSPNLLEDFGNQIKARYCYLSKNYTTLLLYIEEQRQQKTVLFGRLELLAMEACALYQMKEKAKAYAVLLEAYKEASPNDIVMPFLEMGKDMRTLTLAAMHDPDCPVPQAWLKNINQKASLYARHQTLFISDYRKAHEIEAQISLTHRETEVLHDLNKGFSRSEIAANQGLSINTVRLIINTIYEKLRAHNIADLIRIAH